MSEGIDSKPNPAFGAPAKPAIRSVNMRRFVIALTLLAAVVGCDNGNDSSKINGSIHVPAGKQPGPAETINGLIRIDENAVVTKAQTVNGSVHLGAHATAASLNTVNGSITLDAGSRVSGSVASVNGDLTVSDDAEILGSLANVNGKIVLTAAHVGGGIKTVAGSISITGASHVEGGIVVKKLADSPVSLGNDVPRIVIGPGATVQGELRFERKVDLYVSDKATIGSVTGATPVPFTGDTPPN